MTSRGPSGGPELVTCYECRGSGSVIINACPVVCTKCEGTGVSPAPLTEFFGIKAAFWIHLRTRLNPDNNVVKV